MLQPNNVWYFLRMQDDIIKSLVEAHKGFGVKYPIGRKSTDLQMRRNLAWLRLISGLLRKEAIAQACQRKPKFTGLLKNV